MSKFLDPIYLFTQLIKLITILLFGKRVFNLIALALGIMKLWFMGKRSNDENLRYLLDLCYTVSAVEFNQFRYWWMPRFKINEDKFNA